MGGNMTSACCGTKVEVEFPVEIQFASDPGKERAAWRQGRPFFSVVLDHSFVPFQSILRLTHITKASVMNSPMLPKSKA